VISEEAESRDVMRDRIAGAGPVCDRADQPAVGCLCTGRAVE
jgi:hypothetical protein